MSLDINQRKKIAKLRSNYAVLACQDVVDKASRERLNELNRQLVEAESTYVGEKFGYGRAITGIIRRHTGFQLELWGASRPISGGYRLPSDEQRRMLTTTRRKP